MVKQLREKCLPSTRYVGECLYVVSRYEGRFYVMCACRRGIHGPIDQTGRALAFVSGRDAQTLSNALNACVRAGMRKNAV
jgi:hypothetical protein